MYKALLSSLLIASASLWIGSELKYAPDEDLTITHSFLAVSSVSLTALTLEVNGELAREVSGDDLDGALDRESSELITISDEISSASDGRATEFTRNFVELLQESEETSGEEERSASSSSDLEGILVDFSWDEDAEEYNVSFNDEDCEVDEELLEHLTDDVDLRFLLPEDEVEEGDEWELEDPAAYLPLMWPGGLLGFFNEGEEGFNADGRADNKELIESLQVTCTVTFDGEEERDGERVAVLSVSMEIEGLIENEVEPEEGPALTVGIAIERSIEGEVLWDLEHNHLFGAKFEGELKTTISKTGTVTNPDTEEDFDLLDSRVLEGTIVYTITVERE